MEFQEAFDATNPDPAAYALPADAPAEQVNERRTQAAQNLLAGVAANETYWNSRSPLEALAARAQGHASIGVPPEVQDSSGTVTGGGNTPAIETTAATATGTETASTEPAPAPAPDNSTEAVSKLRAQLEAAGMTPDA